MRKYYLALVLISVAILACNENKEEVQGQASATRTTKPTTIITPAGEMTRGEKIKAELVVIDKEQLLNDLEIEIPDGLIMTGANKMRNVYHSQFEGTEPMEAIVKDFRTMLDKKIGTTFLRVESKNKKFKPWDLREMGNTSMHNAIYVYKDGQNALNVKIATNKTRGGVLIYLGKAKIY